jgi:hypothetical protein
MQKTLEYILKRKSGKEIILTIDYSIIDKQSFKINSISYNGKNYDLNYEELFNLETYIFSTF